MQLGATSSFFTASQSFASVTSAIAHSNAITYKALFSLFSSKNSSITGQNLPASLTGMANVAKSGEEALASQFSATVYTSNELEAAHGVAYAYAGTQKDSTRRRSEREAEIARIQELIRCLEQRIYQIATSSLSLEMKQEQIALLEIQREQLEEQLAKLA